MTPLQQQTDASFLRISILHYDEIERSFGPLILHYCRNNKDGMTVTKPLTLSEARTVLGSNAIPTREWIEEYNQWLCPYYVDKQRQQEQHELESHHFFKSATELHNFNKKGYDLVGKLRQEINMVQQKSNEITNHNTIQIDIVNYIPLYQNIRLGDGWWHIRDCAYPGLVVPIQHLPVSDDLKSRLQAWRLKKSMPQFEKIEVLHQEGHELEENILLELNEDNNNTMTDNNNMSPNIQG